MHSSRKARLTRYSAVIGLAAAVAACTGGNPPGSIPQTATPASARRLLPRHAASKFKAVVAIPARWASRAASHALRPNLTPIADEALQIGTAYPNRESWMVDQTYGPLDPSCGSLNWSYTNTIPGVTVTLNPTNTSLTGSTTVSFTLIPIGTAVQQWTQTITPTCTGANPTGNLPVPTNYTIYTVTLDIGRVPQVPAAPAIITNATATPIVGQFIELEGSPQPNVGFVKQNWNPIGGDTVKTYTETKNSASFTNLGAADWKKKLVDFYWIHGSSGTALPLVFNAVFPVFNSHCLHSCTGAEDYWGQTMASSSANVLAPTNVSLTSVTGDVAVSEAGQISCFIGLHFGYVGACHGHGGNPGIHWKMTATAPAGGAGLLDGTQLIDRKDVAGPFPTVSAPPTAYPGTTGSELDTCMRYGNNANAHEPVAGGAAATYESDDSPAFPLLDQWRLFSAMDTFVISFVYYPNDQAGAPDARKNIWVPLGHLNWNWKGSAKNAGTPLLRRNAGTFGPSPARAPSWWRPSGSTAPSVAHPNWSLTSHDNSKDPRANGTNDPLPTWKALYSPQAQACPPGG